MRLRHDDSGFSLIEVLVSALLVALVATFVMTSFSTASHSSGRSKARGTAASLAQQDQERLRAMSVTNLSSVNSSRTVNVCGDTSGGCIPYTVASRADWVADNSGASTCAVSAARAYNLQITSTVTWPGMTVNPLVTKSLVAAPPSTAGGPQGSLAVRVRELDGTTAVSGVPVALSGTATRSGTTDANGCVVWDYLPSGGGYTITVGVKTNFWDPNGQTTITRSATVTGNRLVTQQFTYSPGDTVEFSFQASAASTMYSAKTDRVTVERTGFPTQTFGTSDSEVSSVRAPDVTPGSGYTAWAGECANEKPATQTAIPTLTGGRLVPVTIQIPGIDLQVKNENNLSYSTANPDYTPSVKITTRTAGCPVNVFTQKVRNDGTGRMAFPGVPKGTYDICAEDFSTSASAWYHQQVLGVSISSTAGAGYKPAGSPWNIQASKDILGRC